MDQDSGTNWISDLLPHSIPNCRILTYGYDVDTRGPTPISVQSLFEHGKNLAEDLSRARSGSEVLCSVSKSIGSDLIELPKLLQHERRPIIFLAHSLGGIIVKQVFYSFLIILYRLRV
jgi:hypothetical protein